MRPSERSPSKRPSWHLLKEFPERIVGRDAAITAFDSGPLKASEKGAKEVGRGWRQDGDVVITSVIASHDSWTAIRGGSRTNGTIARAPEQRQSISIDVSPANTDDEPQYRSSIHERTPTGPRLQ